MTPSPSGVRRQLADLGLRPARRLGQNFLVDRRIAARIVEAADCAGRTVVEIGPGLGALSEALAETARELFLVEIDRSMAERLRDRFASRPAVRVIEADALTLEFATLLGTEREAVAVANLPYSVGSRILLRLVEARRQFARLLVMLQREVAERVTAEPATKAYGLLSVFTALYGEGRVLFRVPAGAFVPRPKVESAVVAIRLEVDARVPLRCEKRFREVVRAAFGQRRKTLRGALAGIAAVTDIERAGIDPGRRGETLSVAEFAALANRLS